MATAETYVALKRFRLDLSADTVVYEHGVVPPYFYLLLAGRVVFEVLGDDGVRRPVGEVQPGEPFGVTAAFSGRPTSAIARTTARSTVIAVPTNAASEALRAAPELAVTLIRHLSRQVAGVVTSGSELDDIPSDSAVAPVANAPVGSDAPSASADTLGGFNEQWFFRDETECPACDQRFEYLRVRASAVRPASRDADFRVTYRTVDPSLYAVTVCPHCAHATYDEEFGTLTAIERRALAAHRAERMTEMPNPLCGERTIDDAARSLDLALRCAETRNLGARRRAGLLHRRAWIERSRGDEGTERALLEQTRGAYLTVYEQDPDIQDASAVRVAYLIGDLELRLGDSQQARRWLMECIQMKGAGAQEGLLRMARLRLNDIREGTVNALTRAA